MSLLGRVKTRMRQATNRARPVRVRCHVRHRVPAMNALVRALLSLMPEPAQAPERNAFK